MNVTLHKDSVKKGQEEVMSEPDLMVSGGVDPGDKKTDVYGYFECHHLTLNHSGPCPTCAQITEKVALAVANETARMLAVTLSSSVVDIRVNIEESQRITAEIKEREEDVRREQFETDCTVIDDMMLADTGHGLSDEEQAYEQGSQAALNALRRAWEEREK